MSIVTLWSASITGAQTSPSRRVTVQGHTCNIGTGEYNLPLAIAARTPCGTCHVSCGVSVERCQTLRGGEQRPKYDNAQRDARSESPSGARCAITGAKG